MEITDLNTFILLKVLIFALVRQTLRSSKDFNRSNPTSRDCK